MDASDLIGPRELAAILGVSYGTIYNLSRCEGSRLAACAIKCGYRRPRYRYSRTLLRQAGFLREVAAS